jgi:hypothetical protein
MKARELRNDLRNLQDATRKVRESLSMLDPDASCVDENELSIARLNIEQIERFADETLEQARGLK